MEILVQQLIESHKLNKEEAMQAIRIVTDYLKGQNPGLTSLIDNALVDESVQADRSPQADF